LKSATNRVKQPFFAENCDRIAWYYSILNDQIITIVSA